jgi:hypothetical protein
MDEAMVYNSVPRVVWVMFVWSLVGAGIALATLYTVTLSQWAWKKWCVTAEPPRVLHHNQKLTDGEKSILTFGLNDFQNLLNIEWWKKEEPENSTFIYTPLQQSETVAAPRKRKGKKATARKSRKRNSAA